MKTEPKTDDRVRIGAFPEFHDPTVLFWGTDTGLTRLAEWLHGLAGHTVVDANLCMAPWVMPLRSVEILIDLTENDAGMKQVTADNDGSFRWSLTPDNARRFAALVETVAKSPEPCHHYLDSQAKDEWVVVVSKGEYDGFDNALD